MLGDFHTPIYVIGWSIRDDMRKKIILQNSSILYSSIPLVSRDKSPEKNTLGKTIDNTFTM